MPRVLVIDDETAIANIICQFLENAQFETEIATSGPKALEKAFSQHYDVIILDIMMPEMNGYKVCQRLRQDPRTARSAILALTARGQPVDKRMAMEAGADAHMAKPFVGRAMVEQIQQLVTAKSSAKSPLGFQVSILRLREGTGATTLAANLGVCLAQQQRYHSVVADMVLWKGDLPSRLGLPGDGSWLDLPQVSVSELATCLVLHNSGLAVLPASQTEAGHLSTPIVTRVLRMLRNWYDEIVVDTPVNMGSLAPVIVASSSLVLLVLTPEPAALRQAQASLAAIQKHGPKSLQVWTVLNMIHPQQQDLQRQIEQILGTPVSAILPWSPQECAQACTDHNPVVLGQPYAPLSIAIRALAEKIRQSAREQSHEGNLT